MKDVSTAWLVIHVNSIIIIKLIFTFINNVLYKFIRTFNTCDAVSNTLLQIGNPLDKSIYNYLIK